MEWTLKLSGTKDGDDASALVTDVQSWVKAFSGRVAAVKTANLNYSGQYDVTLEVSNLPIFPIEAVDGNASIDNN